MLDEARAAGGGVEAATQRAGYSGYVTDPDRFRWEIAVNRTALGESLLP